VIAVSRPRVELDLFRSRVKPPAPHATPFDYRTADVRLSAGVQ